MVLKHYRYSNFYVEFEKIFHERRFFNIKFSILFPDPQKIY